jgi:hypothetical protein
MAITGAQKLITSVVLSWEGTSTTPHRFGGTEYRLGQRELGHIHGDHLVDIPFPTKVRTEIVAAELASPHHILPQSGWVSFYLRQDGDIPRAIALLERSYRIALQQRSRRATVDSTP